MPVEDIEFESGDLVDIFFYFLFCKEIAAHVEHDAAPGEARVISYIYCGSALAFRRHNLQEALHGVKKSGRLIGRDYNIF